MSKRIVVFQNPSDILEFVRKVEKYPYDMDMKRGRYIVDAKSLLGLMNLGFQNEIELKVYEEECDDLWNCLLYTSTRRGQHDADRPDGDSGHLLQCPESILPICEFLLIHHEADSRDRTVHDGDDAAYAGGRHRPVDHRIRESGIHPHVHVHECPC